MGMVLVIGLEVGLSLGLDIGLGMGLGVRLDVRLVMGVLRLLVCREVIRRVCNNFSLTSE